ncbi:MAG: hypothetical protein ACI814_004484, partial [Mariniblastus sp.]
MLVRQIIKSTRPNNHSGQSTNDGAASLTRFEVALFGYVERYSVNA